MKSFILAPEAEDDIWNVWQHLALEAGLSVANRLEEAIFEEIAFIARMPGVGHWRRDLTDEPVKFYSIYAYLIVYRPETKPVHVVAILHGRRDVAQLLKERL